MITTIDRTHAAAVGHFELREPRMGQSSRMAISQGESCRPPSPSDTTTSSRFVSAVEEQIEHSKTHWSTLAEQSSSGLGEGGEGDCEAEESNKQEFRQLQRYPTWGGSLRTFYGEDENPFDNGELVVGNELFVCLRKSYDALGPHQEIFLEILSTLADGPSGACHHTRHRLLQPCEAEKINVREFMQLQRHPTWGTFFRTFGYEFNVHDPELLYKRVKVVDFGLSKAKVSKYSHSTLNIGTRRWMAPEVFKANADHKSPICGLPKLKNEAPNHSLFKTLDQGTRGWSVDEIRTMLELTEEALKVDRGPDIWDYVSENLWEHYGFDRASNSCENMWGILLQSYKEIQASTEFELEYRNIIERILTQKLFEDGRNDAGFSLSAPASPLCPFQFRSPSDMVLSISRCCEEMLYDEATDEEMEEVDIHSEDEELSGDSTATFESQVEIAADSHFSRINEPDYETNSNNAGRKMSADTIMEDELISRIAPFVNKQIEDTLKPLLSVLRKREEDDQMHREKLLTIKEEKLALKREKISFAHRVLANF
ncbi:hypothetical protein KC19_9G071700 [Ceratodon purpureus]|uniref:Myb-like domain-containing protein n=1 Tax=Ceratodon purpureus TaxID=3225 RepID=A0A8T0GRC3_CERPU|nr:hypothetical protein KC19_9G071700 [Ceratodon purpureus]